LPVSDRLVLLARLKDGARERARELSSAQPSPLEGGGIDRVGIYLSESEVVFVFEGPRTQEAVRAILDDPVRSTVIAPWLPLFDGPLHAAPEASSWTR
jgi:hypothetical protein